MAATVFDTTQSSWNWTLNGTLPSAKDLALAGPRVLMKIGSFLVPQTIDNMFGARLGQRVIPDATGATVVEAFTTANLGGTEQAAQAASDVLDHAVRENAGSGLASRFSLEGARSLGNVFSYATSKWALGCIVVAIVLNRTTIYASTRRNLVVPWKIRFFLRSGPVILLAVQCWYMLQSIQCQTSPDFGLLRWGNASKHADLLHTQNGGPLHTISSTLLLGRSDEASCLAVKMIPQMDEETGEAVSSELSGSLSLLWPLFQTFSFSQFVETISCAVQGRQVAAETGMTLFEHSLAFAEADAAVGAQIGLGPFGSTKGFNTSAEATEIAITRSMVLKRVNTTPEVLLVGFLSGMNHLTSHILGIFNLQGKFRLLNTGLWGLCFMGFIVWSIITFDLDDLANQSLLRFPTVCIVGFIPHVLVLGGIILCAAIYGTALVLSALTPSDDHNRVVLDSTQQATFLGRLRAAHHNMQANVPLSNIRITMHMDFYTALLRTGFSVMTMASEAVYLNESSNVSIRPRTWLEDDRLREIEAVGAQWLGPNFRLQDQDASLGDGISDNIGLVRADDDPSNALHKSGSGYAKEMTAKKVAARKGNERMIRDGVGATERSGRWIMALEFFMGITRLLLSWWATLMLKVLSTTGINIRPRWLVWLIRRPKTTTESTPKPKQEDSNLLNFWMLSKDGDLVLPSDDNVDVEAEVRNRKMNSLGYWGQEQEKELDESLYDWWRAGGWWGGNDSSGAYRAPEQDENDDTTSVVSFSSSIASGQEEDWESDSENDDGRRTPTQRSPNFSHSREATPFFDNPLSRTDLAALLNPKTPEQRAEAQALSAHLSSDTILTRSRYRKLTALDRSKVLTSTLQRPPNFVPSSASKDSSRLTPDEEAQILEHLIITTRSARSSGVSPGVTREREGDSAGEGPMCVVCQSTPRTIIVWPCRCLSLCDDCRVSLAMNNFDKCVCCRRDVGSFSRIWVP